jgi:hypothetical protein
MSLHLDVFGSFTLAAEPAGGYIEYSYNNGEDVGPSFAAPQSGSAGGNSTVPIEIQSFLKIFHPKTNPPSVTYGTAIDNPNIFPISFRVDVGDFVL